MPKMAAASSLGSSNEGQVKTEDSFSYSPAKSVHDSPVIPQRQHRDEVGRLEQEIRQLQQYLHDQEDRFFQDECKRDEELKTEKKTISELREKIRALKEQIAFASAPPSPGKDLLRQELHDLKLQQKRELGVILSDYDVAKKDLEASEEKVAKLEKQKEDFKEQLEACLKREKRATADKAHFSDLMEEEKERTLAKIQKLEVEKRDLNDRLDEAEQESTELRRVDEDRNRLRAMTENLEEIVAALRISVEEEKKKAQEAVERGDELDRKYTKEVALKTELKRELAESESKREEFHMTKNRLSVSLECLTNDNAIQLHRSQEDLKRMTEKCNSLKEELEEERKVAAGKKVEMCNLKGSLEAERNRVEELQQDVEGKKAMLREKTEELDEKMVQLEGARRCLAAERERRKQEEKDHLESRNATAEETRKITADRDRLSLECDMSMGRVAKLISEAADAKKLLIEEKARADCLNHDLAALRQQQSSVMDQLEASAKESEELRAGKSEAERRAKDVECERDSVRETLEITGRELALEKACRLEEKTSLLEELRTGREELGKQTEAGRELEEELRNEGRRRGAESEKHLREMEDLRREMDTKQEDLARIQNSSEELQRCYRDKQGELDSLKEEMERQLGDLKTTIEERQKKIQCLEEEGERLGEELSEAREELERSQLSLQERDAEKGLMEEDLRDLRERCRLLGETPAFNRQASLRMSGDDEAEVMEEVDVTPVATTSSHSSSVRAVVMGRNEDVPRFHLSPPSEASFQGEEGGSAFKVPKVPPPSAHRHNEYDLNGSFLGHQRDIRKRAEKVSDMNRRLPIHLRSANTVEFLDARPEDKVTENAIRSGTYVHPSPSASVHSPVDGRGREENAPPVSSSGGSGMRRRISGSVKRPSLTLLGFRTLSGMSEVLSNGTVGNATPGVMSKKYTVKKAEQFTVPNTPPQRTAKKKDSRKGK